MEIDEPNSKYPRRSLFGKHPNISKGECCDIYSDEYIEKVRTETEQWNIHLQKDLEEEIKLKKKKSQLKSTILDERILSSVQLDFFGSINFDNYLRTVQVFLNRMAIVARMAETPHHKEVQARYIDGQNKIERQIFKT